MSTLDAGAPSEGSAEVPHKKEKRKLGTTKEKITYYGSRLGALGLIGITSIFVFADSKLDILGDAPIRRTPEDMNAQASRDYQRGVSTLSPAGLFELEYLTGDDIPVRNYTKGNGWAGEGYHNDSLKHYIFGSDCLTDSPYDFRNHDGVDVQYFSGAPDRLIVNGNSDASVRLEFTGLSEHDLKPEGQTTRDVLYAWGCPTD